jgi:hypothetical protein
MCGRLAFTPAYVRACAGDTEPAQALNYLGLILARDNRFVFGVYRRHMKVISYLGTFDRLFGMPLTTQNWNTITAIARVLGH